MIFTMQYIISVLECCVKTEVRIIVGPQRCFVNLVCSGFGWTTLLLYLYGSIIKETANATFKTVVVTPYNGQLLLFLAAFMIIRGNFEEVDLKPIGLIVGLLLAMRNK